jgi:hypothetical protein
MSAQAERAAGETGESGCWCCGRAASEEQLVRLGRHPEVGVCLDCVGFLGRRARDREASLVHERLRSAADSVRGGVTARQWHRLPVIGPVLRWVGRHSPW